jgi:hypothetical protein
VPALADIAGTGAAWLNVHMSNYRRIPFFSYRQLTGGLPGTAAADRLENAIERQIYDRLVMGGLNAVRRKRGLEPRYAYEHEEGDLSLLAESRVQSGGCIAPMLATSAPTGTTRSPPRVRTSWTGPPTAYFTLGSEGLTNLPVWSRRA